MCRELAGALQCVYEQLSNKAILVKGLLGCYIWEKASPSIVWGSVQLASVIKIVQVVSTILKLPAHLTPAERMLLIPVTESWEHCDSVFSSPWHMTALM